MSAVWVRGERWRHGGALDFGEVNNDAHLSVIARLAECVSAQKSADHHADFQAK